MKKLIVALALASLGWTLRSEAAAMCMFSSGNQLVNFGRYSAIGAAVDGSAQLTFTCMPAAKFANVSYSISISSGSSALFQRRHLMAGANTLNYNLFLDPAHTVIWGDGTQGSATKSSNCVSLCTQTVYGEIPAGQSPPPARYRDTVVLTINF